MRNIKESRIGININKLLKLAAKLKQVTSAEAKELRLPWDINDHREKLIHIKIAKMIPLDWQPYGVFNDDGFKVLVYSAHNSRKN